MLCPDSTIPFVSQMKRDTGRKENYLENLTMAKFLFVYRNSSEVEQAEMSPEDMQAAMEQWGIWFQQLGDKLVDGGDGLLPTGKVLKGDGTVTDGPFIEAKELVGGYSILRADNVDDAVELAKGCPIAAMGGTIEVRELAGYTETPPE